MKKLFCVMILAAALQTASCGKESPTASSATPRVTFSNQGTMMVSIKVVNKTLVGTAIASDFTVIPSGTVYPRSFVGDENGVPLAVESMGFYSINLSGPEGYSSTFSPGCSGLGGAKSSTCVITLTEMPLTCDEALWKPTYTKDRLKILSQCEVEVGEVVFVEMEYDGDLTFRFRTPTDRLLRPSNSEIGNTLQIEITCQGPVSQAPTGPTDDDNPKETCKSFNGEFVNPPKVGEFYAAAAKWVVDLWHGTPHDSRTIGWTELHGAKIRKLPRLKLP